MVLSSPSSLCATCGDCGDAWSAGDHSLKPELYLKIDLCSFLNYFCELATKCEKSDGPLTNCGELGHLLPFKKEEGRTLIP